MKYKYYFLLPVIVVIGLSVFLFSSCHKLSTGFSPVSGTYNLTMLNQLFAGFRTTPQTLTVNAGTTQTVYGNKGTILNFYPNSFKDANGNAITSGTIQLQLTEMYSPGQMVRNRVTTINNGQPLLSGGGIYITASQNGQPVYANRYGVYFFQFISATQEMYLFYGNTNNADTVVEWVNPSNTGLGSSAGVTYTDEITFTSSTGSDSLVEAPFYKFDSCMNFGWVQCAYFFSYPASSNDLSIVAPDTSFNPSNTQIYITIPSIAGVLYTDRYDSSNHTFDLSSNSYLSSGVTVTVIAIANKNGTYYYDAQGNILMGTTSQVTLNMKQASTSSILGVLSGL